MIAHIDDLVVHIEDAVQPPHPRARVVRVAVADPALAAAITTAVADAIRGLEAPPAASPIVRVRSRKRLALVTDQLPGAIAVVAVTPRNARHLVTLVDGLRAASVAGVQLVWNGTHDERYVFAALERARHDPTAAPVVLATTDEPAAALRFLVAHRAHVSRRSS